MSNRLIRFDNSSTIRLKNNRDQGVTKRELMTMMTGHEWWWWRETKYNYDGMTGEILRDAGRRETGWSRRETGWRLREACWWQTSGWKLLQGDGMMETLTRCCWWKILQKHDDESSNEMMEMKAMAGGRWWRQESYYNDENDQTGWWR